MSVCCGSPLRGRTTKTRRQPGGPLGRGRISNPPLSRRASDRQPSCVHMALAAISSPNSSSPRSVAPHPQRFGNRPPVGPVHSAQRFRSPRSPPRAAPTAIASCRRRRFNAPFGQSAPAPTLPYPRTVTAESEEKGRRASIARITFLTCDRPGAAPFCLTAGLMDRCEDWK